MKRVHNQILTICSILSFLMAGVGLNAQDEPKQEAVPAKDAEPKSAESKPDKKESKPSEPSLLEKLSKELLKELDDQPATKSAEAQKEDKLDRAAKGMRNAGDKLGEAQTGDETRKIQEQVIRDLDDLIKQLQQPPPNGGGGGGGGGNGGAASGAAGAAQRMQKSGASGQSTLAQMQKQKARQLRGQKQSGGREKKVAENSEERNDAGRKESEEAARKKKLEMDVWGHLPPHLREQLLNTYGERMLPKYEQFVKQFYEALSEQSDSAPRR